MRRIGKLAACALVVVLLSAPPAAAAEDGASALVASFQSVMLDVMKRARRLEVRGRYEALQPAIARTFHVPLMVRIVTGAHWQSGSEAQRRKLVAAFRRMSVSTLATLLDDYSGEHFELLRERPGSRTTVMVDTQLVQPGRDPVDISYVVGHHGGRWWILDVVVAGGISELTVRRSEYARILDGGGYDALIAALDDKADRLLAGTGAPATSSAQR